MNSALESLTYALRALHREVFQFRFSYPLEIDVTAGPRDSLHYYLYSDKLSWSIMSMDPAGIPRARTRLTGLMYKPAYIAWWGLVQLGHFLRHRDNASREAFLRQVHWLESQAVVRSDGAVVWFNYHDSLQGQTLLKAPWVSAYDQGLVISALVRGHRMTGRPRLLELLRGASRIFSLDVQDGGVRETLYSGALYSELPGQPVPGIQDGFMTALLGLYDLFVETGDPAVRQLFDDGIAGLKAMLPAWDYRKRWSWYSARYYLCPPAYHYLNRSLLQVLGNLTGEAVLAEYATAWKADHLPVWTRAEIFLMFLLTKNACRIRNRTWKFDRAKVKALAFRQPVASTLEVSMPAPEASAQPQALAPGAD